MSFVVPSAAELALDEHELLAQGLLCPDSPLDPVLLAALQAGNLPAALASENPCQDKSKNGLLIASPFRIERTPDDRNHSAFISAASWSPSAQKRPVVARMPWTSTAAASVPSNDCVGAGFVEVPQSKQAIGLELELDPAAREDYVEAAAIPGQPGRARTEVPYVEGLASAGKFKVVRDNLLTTGQVLQLEWEAPKEPVAAGGLLVRFWLLAGDDRLSPAQTVSWTERVVCVVPAPR